MVWGGGGGKAPKAPKVVDFKAFPPKIVELLRISWNYCRFHVFCTFSCFPEKGRQWTPGTHEKALRLQCFWAGEAERLEIARNDNLLFFCKNTKITNFTWKTWNFMKIHEKYGFPSTCAASSPQNHWKTIAIARFSGGLARVVAPGPKGEEMEGI